MGEMVRPSGSQGKVTALRAEVDVLPCLTDNCLFCCPAVTPFAAKGAPIGSTCALWQ